MIKEPYDVQAIQSLLNTKRRVERMYEHDIKKYGHTPGIDKLYRQVIGNLDRELNELMGRN